MNDLIIRALHEGGVNRQYRFHIIACNPRRKSSGMLLGNTDVEITRREFRLKLNQARAFAHRGGNAYQLAVGLGHIANPATKHLSESLLDRSIWGFYAHDAQARIEFSRTVVGNRVFLSVRIAVAFFSNHMQKLHAVELFQIVQRRNQRVQIMPVNRADVVQAKCFKHGRGYKHTLGVLFKTASKLEHPGRTLQHMSEFLARTRYQRTTHDFGQMAIERTDRR